MQLFAIGLLAGSLAIARLTTSADRVFDLLWPIWMVAVLSCSLWWLLRHHRLAPLVCITCGALIGAGWTGVAFQSAADRVIDARLIGEKVTIEGRIVGVPRELGGRHLFDLQIRHHEPIGDILLAPRRVRVVGRFSDRQPAAGETWRVTVKLRPLSGLRNAGSFDRVRYLLGQGVDATGSLVTSPAPVRLGTGVGIDSWRQELAAGVDAVGGPERASALIKALVLGIKDDIDAPTWRTLRESGTAHLLAISGLHIALVAGWSLCLASWSLRRCGLNSGRSRRYALLVSVLCSVAYALLAGFGLPVRRAIVMLAVWSLALARLRVLPPHRALSAALILVLLVDPLAPLSIGFWLSFGTVSVIALIHRRRSQLSVWIDSVRAALRTHVLLGLLMMPVGAWFFQSGAWAAPIANLLAVPLVGLLIVPLAFLVVAFAPWFPAGACFLSTIFERASAGLLDVLNAVLALSNGAWTLTMPSLEVTAFCVIGLLLLILSRGRLLRLLAVTLILPALLANVRSSDVEGFELHVLDVRQGLAALVLTPSQTWLYDTGDMMMPGVSMLEAVVVPYLNELGRRTIDVIVVSHPDRDHAAGLDDAIARWPAARVIVGMADPRFPADAERCVAGDTELHDGVRFSFLHPAAEDVGSENDRSCVLMVHFGASRALLTGDIEAAAERQLIERLGDLRVSVLTAPHHGSRTSSTGPFIDALRPEHVVFPAGRGNRYGFPHEDVQMRYNTAGAIPHLTSSGGAVRFLFGASGLVEKPVSWRDERHRFWHDMVEPPNYPARSDQR